MEAAQELDMNMDVEGRHWVRASWMELIEPRHYMQNAFNRRNA